MRHFLHPFCLALSLLVGTAFAQQASVDNTFLKDNVITNEMQNDEITNLRNELNESLRRLDIVKRCHANNEMVLIMENNNPNTVASCTSVGNVNRVFQRFNESCERSGTINCSFTINLSAYAGRKDLKLSATGTGNIFGTLTTGTIDIDLSKSFSNRVIASQARETNPNQKRLIRASYNVENKRLTIENRYSGSGTMNDPTRATVKDVTIQSR